jgi:hypothetical protein
MEKEITGSMAYIEVKILEIGGFASAFQALRLPFGKECRSEAFSEQTCTLGEIDNEVKYTASVFVNTQDLHLMSVLVKRGDEHAKVVRGIMVYAEINAPRYWWQEMDTYRIGTDRLSSESTMHIQGKGMSEEELIKMKEELTEGTMQKRVQVFSYQTLRRIYFQRRNHRLPHWREFCQWVEGLPFAKELITVE